MNDIKLQSIRDGYGEGILEVVAGHPDVIVLTADLAESTRVSDIAKRYPHQFVDCGVAEQNMLGVAAGLSLEGKIPFVNSFAVFNPGRNWDQLRVSICYPHLNVKVVGHHAGFSASYDGATHQALEDIALTRVIPNLTVLSPCDFNEARQCVKAAVDYKGPVYIRIGKYAVSSQTQPQTPFMIGKAEILKPGKDLTLIVTGALTGTCMDVAKTLAPTLDIELIKISTIVPLDQKTIASSARKTGLVVTVEDHQVTGGLGGAVAEVLSQVQPTTVYRLGMQGQFGESGSETELLKRYRLDAEGIISQLKHLKNI